MRLTKRFLLKTLALLGFFVFYTYFIYLLIILLDLHDISIPKSIPEIKRIHDQLYKKPKYQTLTLFSTIYLYEQTFCLPGCIFLNILAGSFYGLFHGSIITSILTGVGGTLSFLISKFTICDFIKSIFKNSIYKLRQEYNENLISKKSDILFIFSIRMMPIMPGWLVNLSAPILNVNPGDYMIGTFVGTLPYNFILANVGTTLNNLNSVKDIFSTQMLVLFLTISLCLLFITICKNKLKKIMEKSSKKNVKEEKKRRRKSFDDSLLVV